MNPFDEARERFRAFQAKIRESAPREPNAITLATADERGRPALRVVLLKGLDERGFVFYTNTGSRKGRDLAANPFAAICVYFDPVEEQFRAEGSIEPVSAAEADAYWAIRPRESQLGAWASDQSRPLAARADLEARLAEVAARFEGQPVPRPPHWSGYRLLPARMEFWKGRPHRLHERDLYEKGADGVWRRSLLNP